MSGREVIEQKKEEILKIVEESESLQELLCEEINEKEEQIKETKNLCSEVSESLNALKNEYKKSESQIVSLQYSIETAKNTLRSHQLRKNELETLNDKWESSVRTLEYYNNQLEEQFQQAENFVLNLHKKIQLTSSKSKENISHLEEKNEEIKKIIKNKSRGPSPIPKPPVKGPNIIEKQDQIQIINSSILEDSLNITIIVPDPLFVSENTLIIKEKNTKKTFEFKKIIKKSDFLSEVRTALKVFKSNKNVCVILNSSKSRQSCFNSVVKQFIEMFSQTTVEVNFIEIVKETEVNLIQENWQKVQVKDLELIEFQKKPSRNHVVFSLRSNFSYLQIIDLGEVSEDHDLSESFSINASLFYLEELMMDLAKEKPVFTKSLLNRKLSLSLNSNFFLQFFMQFESLVDLPVLSFSARLQAMFGRSACKNQENHRTLALLEKERLSNFKILRLIEAAQKELSLLKSVENSKESIIESFKLKINDSGRRFTEKPKKSSFYNRKTRIPSPK